MADYPNIIFYEDQYNFTYLADPYDSGYVDTFPEVDLTAPIVLNYSPTLGSDINTDQALSVDVTEETAFRRILLFIQYTNGDTDVVYDGDGFTPYFAPESTRSIISGGFRFSIKRLGGWPASLTLKVYAYDQSGNEGV
jgi:hypothetical protein